MSINVKKYTKDQMAKMAEDAQEKTAALEAEITELKSCIDAKNDLLAEYANLKAAMQRKNVALTEQIDQMNGEAITHENVIANLKADLDASKAASKLLNDQGQGYWRAWQASKREVADLRNKLNDTEAALGRANSEMAVLRNDLTCEKESSVYLTSVCRWLSGHPWWNLWAWVKRKLKMA